MSVYYPLHPFHGGGELPVSRRFGNGRVEQVEVESTDRRQLLPRWMTNQDRCQQLSVGADARRCLAALWELTALLRTSACHLEAVE